MNRLHKGLALLLVASIVCSGCQKQTQLNNENESTSTMETDVETVTSSETDTVVETTEVDDTELGDNLLANGDFHSDMAKWATYIAKGGMADMAAPGGVGKVNIHKSGNVNYSVQAYYDGFELTQGVEYEFSFDMYSTIDRNIEARLQINGGDYHPYFDVNTNISTTNATYTYTFTMNEGTDPAPRLCFNLGTPDGMEDLGEHTIFIDNVSLKIRNDSGAVVTKVEDKSSDININQIGFLKNADKKAIIRNSQAGEEFCIKDNNGNIVFEGKLSDSIRSVAAGEEVNIADFSEYTDEGEYVLCLNDGRTSYSFKIGDDVYDELLKQSFRFLYSQRCGVALSNEEVSGYAHEACHMQDAVVYGTNVTKHVTGGWHDAGDYGRYVVPGAVTVADLLMSYEDCKSLWDMASGDNMGIPESGNKIPDILDEAKYELDFMLQMQDEDSGGVYHKISGYDFPGFVLPDKETDTMVLSPVSATATADFAAVMAWGSKIYSKYDKALAKEYLDAAKKAWKYLETCSVGEGYRNPDDILTGEYPDMRDPDERYFAAVELYDCTGDKEYKDYIASILDNYVAHGYGWAQVSSYGNRAYLNLDSGKQDKKYVELLQNAIVENADIYLNNCNSDGYGVSLGDGYCWGSNMAVANNGRMLLDAYRITKDEKYMKAAYSQIDYICGQNAMSYCYVTGFGTVYPMHVHHRPSMASGYSIPGMVVGGPDVNMEDPFAKATLSGQPAAKCYADSDQSFSTNEVTIYWNSPFVYLLGSEINEY